MDKKGRYFIPSGLILLNSRSETCDDHPDRYEDTVKEQIIHIRDFSFSFGDIPILRRVNLQVGEGEYVSLIGPNGAGKSTFLNCIMRILKGGQGHIVLAGRDIASYSQRKLARLMSYVPQQDIAGFPVTVGEFVMMSRYPHMSPFTTVSPGDHEAVDEALAITGCTHLAGRSVATLSGGERRTVSIAAALAQQCPVMLLDEPTTFLDPKHEMDIFALISRINRDYGRTILMVTHDINHAALHSDCIGILKEGQCVFFGKPRDMMNNDVLAPVYGTSFTFIPHPVNGFPVIVPKGGGL